MLYFHRPGLTAMHHDVSVNHGGVAIVAAVGIKLTAVTIGVQPTTFECVAARVTSGMSSCVLLSVYRPGSSAVTASFFSELADVLDRFSTYVHYVEPLVLAGDINIWLERSTDPHAVEFRELLESYGPTAWPNMSRTWRTTRAVFLTSSALAATYFHLKLPLKTLVFLSLVLGNIFVSYSRRYITVFVKKRIHSFYH